MPDVVGSKEPRGKERVIILLAFRATRRLTLKKESTSTKHVLPGASFLGNGAVRPSILLRPQEWLTAVYLIYVNSRINYYQYLVPGIFS